MWTLANAVCRCAFVWVLVLLLSGVQTKRVRPVPARVLRLGSPSTTGVHLDEGHGVAEGSGPNGLYGFFGCLFSYSVCQEDEVCVNDNLFGSCQKIGTPVDRYQYSLKEDQLQQLTFEVEKIVAEGYKWKDLYTQCVLGNVLLAFELNQHYDANFCKQRSKRVPLEGPYDVLFPVKRFYWKTPRVEEDLRPRYDDAELGFLYQKKAEIPYQRTYIRSLSEEQDPTELKWSKYDFVNVHKYQKNRKRQPLSDQITWHSYSPHKRREDFLAHLTPDELDLLNRIVRMDYEDEGRSNTNEDVGNYDAKTDDQETDEDDENDLIFQLTSDDQQNKGENDQFEDRFSNRGLKSEDEKMYDDLTREREVQDDHRASRDKVRDLFEDEKRFPDLWSEQKDHLEDRNMAFTDLEDQNDPDYKADLWQPASDLPDDVDDALQTESKDQATIKRENDWSPEREIPTDVKRTLERTLNSGIDDDKEEMREERGAGVTTPAMATTSKAKYDIVDASYAYVSVFPKTNSIDDAGNIIAELQELLQLPPDSVSDLSVFNGDINFRINQNSKGLNASSVAVSALSSSNKLKNRTGFQIVGAGVGHVSETYISVEDVKTNGRKYFLLTFILCGVIAGVVLAVILLYVIRRHRISQKKLAELARSTEKVGPEASKDYQELCRHHMQSKLSEKPEPLHVASRIGSVSAMENAPVHSPSSRSSTSSWSEEPVATSMDISTGHIVLSYMEDHLKNKDRLDEEWEALCAYEPETCSVAVASLPQNERKNRYSDILPYDHSRVVLHAAMNMTGSNYINASTITDHDPRNPAYLVTQGPLPNTVADFWQMVWEQGSVVIVNLTKLTDQGTSLSHCYWPSEGSDLYHIYEVHLVSEHIWCEDYLVRSFYLRNLQTNETRTVTQFHFLTWPDMKTPGSSKVLLDFRRKVNKSYRGRSCPILVHCSDGAGRCGTYCLIDMVLNRMTKGTKEIDIAATLEHIRDQRMQMVKTKEQFQFVLATIAEEVHAILKALPQ